MVLYYVKHVELYKDNFGNYFIKYKNVFYPVYGLKDDLLPKEMSFNDMITMEMV